MPIELASLTLRDELAELAQQVRAAGVGALRVMHINGHRINVQAVQHTVYPSAVATRYSLNGQRIGYSAMLLALKKAGIE